MLMSGIIETAGKRYYTELVSFYTAPKSVIIDKNCAGYTVTNLGDTPITLNQKPLFPSPTPATALGDSFTVLLDQLDIYRGTLDLAFIQPLGVAPRAMIVQYVYMTDQR